MKDYKTILWDIDGTVLDFHVAERNAIKACFNIYKLGECSEEMLKDYSTINKEYWLKLERGEVEKSEVYCGRFRDFFQKYGIDGVSATDFNKEYQIRLGDTISYIDNSYELIKALKAKYKQYAITNGSYEAQVRKLKKSGLDKLFDAVFISEIVGFEKPSIEFFNKVFEKIGDIEKNEVLLIGDSLTGDIQGANNAGISCVWYNPNKETNFLNLKIDYEISSLKSLTRLLKV